MHTHIILVGGREEKGKDWDRFIGSASNTVQ